MWFDFRLSTWVLGVSWHVKPSGKCQEKTGIKFKKMLMGKYLCVAFLPLHRYLQQTKNLLWVLPFIFKPVILLLLLHFVGVFGFNELVSLLIYSRKVFLCLLVFFLKQLNTNGHFLNQEQVIQSCCCCQDITWTRRKMSPENIQIFI